MSRPWPGTRGPTMTETLFAAGLCTDCRPAPSIVPGGTESASAGRPSSAPPKAQAGGGRPSAPARPSQLSPPPAARTTPSWQCSAPNHPNQPTQQGSLSGCSPSGSGARGSNDQPTAETGLRTVPQGSSSGWPPAHPPIMPPEDAQAAPPTLKCHRPRAAPTSQCVCPRRPIHHTPTHPQPALQSRMATAYVAPAQRQLRPSPPGNVRAAPRPQGPPSTRCCSPLGCACACSQQGGGVKLTLTLWRGLSQRSAALTHTTLIVRLQVQVHVTGLMDFSYAALVQQVQLCDPDQA